MLVTVCTHRFAPRVGGRLGLICLKASRGAMNEKSFWDRLTRIQKELPVLLKEVPHNRVRTIKEAIDLLDYLELLHDVFDDLWNSLADNRARHLEDLARFPDEKPNCDLVAAIVALNAAVTFLRYCPKSAIAGRRPYSYLKISEDLSRALSDLSEGGAPAPMLRPLTIKGRRPDVSLVLGLKGILAGLMERKQREGMTRQEAARWIADNTPPKLAARISRKPITARSVEEWRDRFGGKHAPQDTARKAYLVWSQESSQLTKKDFKRITEGLIEEFC